MRTSVRRSYAGGVSSGGLFTGSSAVSATGCADWASWAIGSRTVWNPVKNLDIGVEVAYTALDHSAFSGGTTTFAPAGAASHTFAIAATNVLSGIVRIQRNFSP